MKTSEEHIRDSLDKFKEEQEKRDRHVDSYAARVKQWWNSKLYGAHKKADIEGPDKVECVVTSAEGKEVAKAVGCKTRKRSAHGAARAAAVSKVCAGVKAKHGGKRVYVNLAELNFEYRKVEG